MSLANKERPAQADFYLRFQTNEALRKDTVRKLYATIKEKCPDGILHIYETTDNEGNPKQAFLVHRVNEEGKHVYEVPLVRNLTADEIYEVAVRLNTTFTEGDYLFETSTMDEDCCPYEDELIDIEPEIYEELAKRLTERSHNLWVDERVAQGWHLGETRNDKNKTHPLIKPWNLLSEEQKAIDFDLPKNMLDLLEEFGYTVISTDELTELLK